MLWYKSNKKPNEQLTHRDNLSLSLDANMVLTAVRVKWKYWTSSYSDPIKYNITFSIYFLRDFITWNERLEVCFFANEPIWAAILKSDRRFEIWVGRQHYKVLSLSSFPNNKCTCVLTLEVNALETILVDIVSHTERFDSFFLCQRSKLLINTSSI